VKQDEEKLLSLQGSTLKIPGNEEIVSTGKWSEGDYIRWTSEDGLARELD
jgi:hypothetical protein